MLLAEDEGSTLPEGKCEIRASSPCGRTRGTIVVVVSVPAGPVTVVVPSVVVVVLIVVLVVATVPAVGALLHAPSTTRRAKIRRIRFQRRRGLQGSLREILPHRHHLLQHRCRPARIDGIRSELDGWSETVGETGGDDGWRRIDQRDVATVRAHRRAPGA